MMALSVLIFRRLGIIKKVYGPSKMCRTIDMFRKNALISTHFSSSKTEDSQTKIQTFQEVYRNDLIGYYGIFLKLKWPQTLFLFALCPTTAVLSLNKILDVESTIQLLATSGFLTLNLYLYSFFLQKTIGFIYLSEDENTTKVSYLDFWGNRVDEEHSISDVMVFSDVEPNPFEKVFKLVYFYSHDKKLKLFCFKSKVTDKDKFIKIFGSELK